MGSLAIPWAAQALHTCGTVLAAASRRRTLGSAEYIYTRRIHRRSLGAQQGSSGARGPVLTRGRGYGFAAPELCQQQWTGRPGMPSSRQECLGPSKAAETCSPGPVGSQPRGTEQASATHSFCNLRQVLCPSDKLLPFQLREKQFGKLQRRTLIGNPHLLQHNALQMNS